MKLLSVPLIFNAERARYFDTALSVLRSVLLSKYLARSALKMSGTDKSFILFSNLCYPMCYAMRNPPFFIVTYGAPNSVPLYIATLTQYRSLLTFILSLRLLHMEP